MHLHALAFCIKIDIMNEPTLPYAYFSNFGTKKSIAEYVPYLFALGHKTEGIL